MRAATLRDPALVGAAAANLLAVAPWNSAYYAQNLGLADGAAITTVPNQGTGAAAITDAGTPARRPTFLAADPFLNDQPSMELDGVANGLTGVGAPFGAQPHTLVAILNLGTFGALQRIWGVGTGTSGATGPYIGVNAADQWTMAAGTALAGPAVVPESHCVVGFFNGAGSTLEVDGVQVIAGNAGATALNVGDRALGSNAAGTNAFCFANYGFVAALTRALTAQEKANLLKASRLHYDTL